jgi:hypothetical protein
MPRLEFDETLLAGNFPPGLNTASPAYDLQPDETPDGYGFDLSKDGRLVKGTIPSGTARIAKTATITAEGVASVPFYWHYNRLWNITGLTAAGTSSVLYYGASFYQDAYYRQRNGFIPFDEDAQVILVVIPFGADSLFVGKSTGGYVVNNCSDGRAFFGRSDIMQEMAVSAAARALELDGAVYTSNASGLFALSQGQTTEATRKVRNDLTPFANKTITADYSKKRIICGSTGVFEADTGKLFEYSGSSFRYTTPQFHFPDWRPFSTDMLRFVVEHGDTTDKTITYQVKYEDEDWSDENDVDIAYDGETFTVAEETLADAMACKKLQIRITDMSSNLYLKEIRQKVAGYGTEDYSV